MHRTQSGPSACAVKAGVKVSPPPPVTSSGGPSCQTGHERAQVGAPMPSRGVALRCTRHPTGTFVMSFEPGMGSPPHSRKYTASETLATSWSLSWMQSGDGAAAGSSWGAGALLGLGDGDGTLAASDGAAVVATCDGVTGRSPWLHEAARTAARHGTAQRDGVGA